MTEEKKNKRFIDDLSSFSGVQMQMYTFVGICKYAIVGPWLFSDCAVWYSENREEPRMIAFEREGKNSEHFGTCLFL